MCGNNEASKNLSRRLIPKGNSKMDQIYVHLSTVHSTRINARELLVGIYSDILLLSEFMIGIVSFSNVLHLDVRI